MKLLLKSNTVRQRLKVFAIALTVLLLVWGYAGYVQSNAKTARELQEAAQILRLTLTLRVAAGLVMAWCLFSLALFRRRWRQAQERINQMPGVCLSIAAPRALGDDVREATDFWRRLASYLPRPDELPSPHITMEIAGTRDVVLYAVFIPAIDGLEQSLREEIIREWPGAQLRQMAANPDDVAPVERHRLFPDPARMGNYKAPVVAWNDFTLSGGDSLPLHQDAGRGTRGKDPVEAFLGALSAIDSDAALGIQFYIRPALPALRERWQQEVQSKENQAAKLKQAKQVVPKEFLEPARLIEERLAKATVIWEVGVRVWAASAEAEETRHGLDRLARVILAQTRGKHNQLVAAKINHDARPVQERHYPAAGGVPLTDIELGRLLHLPSAAVADPYKKLYRAGSTDLPPDPRSIVRAPAGKRIYGAYTANSGEKVYVGHDLEFATMGAFIAGATGAGKSTVLANIIIQDFLNGAGGLVLDPHVDFIRDVIRNVPLDRLDDLLIYDIRDCQPLLYNICTAASDLGAAATVESIMGAIQVMMGANWATAVRMQEILYNAFYLALGALGQRASVLQVDKLLKDEFYREDLIAAIRDPVQYGATIDFWRRNFAGWNESEKSQAVAIALRRLNALIGRPEVRRSLAMPLNTLNLAAELDRGRLILVPLHVSMGEEAQKILGALLVRDFYNAMLMREAVPKQERRKAILCLDEMASLVGNTAGFVEKLAAQCRKYGSALVGAAQFYKQLPPAVLNEVLENFRTQIAMSGGADYAETVRDIMGRKISVSDVQNLAPFTAYVKMAVFGGVTTPCLIQTLPPIEPAWARPEATPGYHQAPPAEWNALLPGAPPVAAPPEPANPAGATTAAKLFAYVKRLAQSDPAAATDYVASLPKDDFEALLATQREYDAWKRQEILHNPGLIKDPISRAYALSRLEHGVRHYMMDALYVRDFYRRAGGNGAGAERVGRHFDAGDPVAESDFYYTD
jgi:hypothetical protein